MKKIYLFNSRAYIAFCARALLFPIFFASTILISAHPIANVEVENTGSETSESLQDSLSLKSDKVETAKIYISEGTTFYNAQEIHGNVEIVQKEKIVKAAKKTGHQLAKALPKKQTVVKPKIEGEKYTVKVRFTPLPFESNTVFSGSGENSITAPTTNSQFRIVALVVQYQISFYIPFQEKNNSKYIMSLANEISHWQMRIRPPPTV